MPAYSMSFENRRVRPVRRAARPAQHVVSEEERFVPPQDRLTDLPAPSTAGLGG